ncbi:hypothetical protein Sp245p_09295 [Azospirillum baldaniorum]|nr:hypothetical protein Sp245p_09295 [Azospirillum baldaniorum]
MGDVQEGGNGVGHAAQDATDRNGRSHSRSRAAGASGWGWPCTSGSSAKHGAVFRRDCPHPGPPPLGGGGRQEFCGRAAEFPPPPSGGGLGWGQTGRQMLYPFSPPTQREMAAETVTPVPSRPPRQ